VKVGDAVVIKGDDGRPLVGTLVAIHPRSEWRYVVQVGDVYHARRPGGVRRSQ